MRIFDRIDTNNIKKDIELGLSRVQFLSPSSGTIDIKKGDAVVLKDNNTAGHSEMAEEVIAGQAEQDVTGNNIPFSVIVKGVVTFNYTGTAPDLTGENNSVSSSDEPGKVAKDEFGAGKGMAISVDDSNKTVTVVL